MLVVGDVLGALCKVEGPSVYLSCKDHILELIQSSLERKVTSPDQCQPDDRETKTLFDKLATMVNKKEKPGSLYGSVHL